jgi:hypothetical protein
MAKRTKAVWNCDLCGADIRTLFDDGVLTAPVEVFDHTLEVAPTLERCVCEHCAAEVAATHAMLQAELRAAGAPFRPVRRI